MKILVITPYLPYPNAPSGGASVLFTLLEALSQQHKLYLATMYEPDEAAQLGQISKWAELVVAVEKVESSDQRQPPLAIREPHQSVWALSKLILSALGQYGASFLGVYARPKPDQMRFWQALTPVIVQLQPDVIQLEYGHFCRLFARRLKRFGTVVGAAHDVEFKPARRYAERARGWQRWGYWLRFVALRQAELAAYRHLSKVYTLSACDAAVLKSAGVRSEVGVRPAGVRFGPMPDFAQRREKQLLFVGAMHRPENIEAVRFLRFEVMPRVWQVCKDAELHIVGKGAPVEVQSWAAGVPVTFHGYQSELQAMYAKATIALVPIFVGGGVIVKLLEALASGTPTVATPVANEGIGAPEGKALLLAQSAEEFSQSILTLLHNPRMRQALSQSAREFAEAQFQIERIAQTLTDDYEQLTLAAHSTKQTARARKQ